MKGGWSVEPGYVQEQQACRGRDLKGVGRPAANPALITAID
jgi:hypothetical protein